MLAPAKGIQSSANAQGWVWGRGATGAGQDTWAVTADNAGNSFGGGIIYTSGTSTFGPGISIVSGGCG